MRSMLLTAAALAVFGSACSAVKTTIPKAGQTCKGNGLVYRLPKRKFVLSVKLDDKKAITSVSAQATDPYPEIDQAKQFCGSFHSNFVAENTVDLQVSSSGLLTSASAESKAKIAEALQAAAKAAGEISGVFAFEQPKAPPVECLPGMTHSILVDPPEKDPRKEKLCGVEFEVERLPVGGAQEQSVSITEGTYDGIFYRQDEPYEVKVDTSGVKYSAILFAPNFSPIRFLPVEKNLFADSKATMAFSGGMPTQYKEQVGGEAIGLLSLPSDVLEAYFGAVGAIFEKIGTASTDKAKIETSAASLADETRKRMLAEEKLRICREAIASEDQSKISTACQ